AEELQIALHLTRGEGFRSPFNDSSTAPLTSWSAPAYPFLGSVVFRLTGTLTPRATLVLHLINIFAFAASGAGLFLLGTCVFGRLPGVMAAVFFFAHPMFLRLTSHLWEHYLALALFIWVAIAAVKIH